MRIKFKPKPKHGEYRTIKKFLWLPKILCRELRWLERVEIGQSYESSFGLANERGTWKDWFWCNN